MAGAALLRIMLDPTPEGSRAAGQPDAQAGRRRAAVPPPAEHSFAEQVSGAIQSALENAVAAEAGLLSLAEGLLSDRGKGALQHLATLLPEWLRPPERFVFNKPCSGDRKFCWAEADFGDVRAIRAALGGKVNDCVLSVVVRAIARYIRLHGEKVEGRFLRVVCPVNLRSEEQGESLGNRITFLPVVLPLDVSDPVEMLRAVSSRMEIMKDAHAAELVAIAASFLGTAPAPMQELFWRGIPLVPLPVPLLNLICTNVPGSPVPLYTVGRRMVASYPQVPTGYELGLGVAVQSYDGKLFFGVTADAHVAPDAGRLRDYIRASFDELARAAGVKRAAKGRKREAAATARTETRRARRQPVKSAAGASLPWTVDRTPGEATAGSGSPQAGEAVPGNGAPAAEPVTAGAEARGAKSRAAKRIELAPAVELPEAGQPAAAAEAPQPEPALV